MDEQHFPGRRPARCSAYQHAYNLARRFDDYRTEKIDAMRSQLQCLADELKEHRPEQEDCEAIDHVRGFINGLAEGCADRGC